MIMDQSQGDLDRARAHAAQAVLLIVDQRRRIADLKNLGADTSQPELLLDCMFRVLDQAMMHLQWVSQTVGFRESKPGFAVIDLLWTTDRCATSDLVRV